MTNGSPARRRPTLSAVAAVAGTSVPTVSKVLRGGTDVSPDMRLKVMDAVRAVGYTRRGGSAGARFRDEADAPTTIELVVHHAESTWVNRAVTRSSPERRWSSTVSSIRMPFLETMPTIMMRPIIETTLSVVLPL